jgi:hypothetical protein
MSVFSRLFRRKRSETSAPQKGRKSEHHIPVEVFSVTEEVIVEAPMGTTPGTVLDQGIIRSCITSVLKNQGSKVNDAIIDHMRAPHDFASSGYSHNTERGYAAIVLDTATPGVTKNPLQRRVLIGSPNFVARATTTFHNNIAAVINKDLAVDSTLHVVAIDGIAYAAIVIKRSVS